jgi:glycerol uptake facilitator-like aquaporin
MFGHKDKKHSLYYLLPGMTRANRHKRRRVFWWAFGIGLIVSALIAGVIYFVNRGPQP